jgi:F-box and WD-40 domain protein CDC4
MHILQGHSARIDTMVCNESIVITGSLDTTIRVWNLDDGSCRSIFSGHTSLVGSLALQNDTLISGSSDGFLRSWSLTRNRQLLAAVVAGENQSVTSLCFVSDSLVASADSNGRLMVMQIGDRNDGGLPLLSSQGFDIIWHLSCGYGKLTAIGRRGTNVILKTIVGL